MHKWEGLSFGVFLLSSLFWPSSGFFFLFFSFFSFWVANSNRSSKILAYKSACIFSVAFHVVSFHFFFVGHFSRLGGANLRFFEKNAKWNVVTKIMIFHDFKICINFTGAAEVRNFVFQDLEISQFLNLRKEAKIVGRLRKGKESKMLQ